MAPDPGDRQLQARYRLGALIADGGMAQVYRAHDSFLARDVAIKIFRATATEETDARRQEDEVNVLARLSHPNLVTLLDVAVDRTNPDATRIFYVMELVEGTDLKRRLDEGPLVARQVAQLGYYVATALEYVHANGIVHRDVKPANILLTFNGDGTRVTAKLGDFGVASIGPAEPIGDDEIVTGTVAYLSPEQARGEEVGPASDVYALGLVLLQCFSAALAFPGPPEHSARSRLLNDPDMHPSVPADWVPLLRAMTARDAADRPDVHDVALALRQMFVAETGRHRASESDGPAAAIQALAYSDDAIRRILSVATRALRVPVAVLEVDNGARTWSVGLDDDKELGGPEDYAFGAAVPVVIGDSAVGELRVHGHDESELSAEEEETLRDLAALAARELGSAGWRDTLAGEDESAWFASADVDDSGAIITNRSSTGPIEVASAP